MTPADLHAAVVAAVTARLELARSATPGPWEHVDYASPAGQPMTREGLPSTYMGCGSVITIGEEVAGGSICAPNGDLYPRGGYSPSDDMAHIAANDPAATIRHCEADLATLEDHTPWYFDDFGAVREIWYCRPCLHTGKSPCDELVRRARAEQVEVADG